MKCYASNLESMEEYHMCIPQTKGSGIYCLNMGFFVNLGLHRYICAWSAAILPGPWMKVTKRKHYNIIGFACGSLHRSKSNETLILLLSFHPMLPVAFARVILLF